MTSTPEKKELETEEKFPTELLFWQNFSLSAYEIEENLLRLIN